MYCKRPLSAHDQISRCITALWCERKFMKGVASAPVASEDMIRLPNNMGVASEFSYIQLIWQPSDAEAIVLFRFKHDIRLPAHDFADDDLLAHLVQHEQRIPGSPWLSDPRLVAQTAALEKPLTLFFSEVLEKTMDRYHEELPRSPICFERPVTPPQALTPPVLPATRPKP